MASLDDLVLGRVCASEGFTPMVALVCNGNEASFDIHGLLELFGS